MWPPRRHGFPFLLSREFLVKCALRRYWAEMTGRDGRIARALLNGDDQRLRRYRAWICSHQRSASRAGQVAGGNRNSQVAGIENGGSAIASVPGDGDAGKEAGSCKRQG